MMSLLFQRVAACVCACASLAVAQGSALPDGWESSAQGHRFRFVEADCGACGISVAWDHAAGTDAAPSNALAHAVALRRAAEADRVLPSRVRTQVEFADGFAVFSVWLPGDALETGPAWLSTLCGSVAAERGDDMSARCIALAALAADDYEWLYPGEALQARLRRALFDGSDPRACGPLGSSASLLALKPESFGKASKELPPLGLQVAAVGPKGALDPLRAALAAIPCGAAVANAARMPARKPVDEALRFVPHPRIDAHYVACALALPDETPGLARLIAVEALRIRARSRFLSQRGNESLARAPFVSHEALLGDSMLTITRRGAQGSPSDVPRREVEELLASMGEPIQATELASAVAIVRAEHATLPFSDAQLAALRAAPAAAATRARALLLRGRAGISDEALRDPASQSAVAVDAQLRAFVAAPRAWAGLEPTWRDPLGG